MAIKMHTVNTVIGEGLRPNVYRKDFLEADSPKAVQVKSRPHLKNTTSQRVRTNRTISVEVRIYDCRVTIAFSIMQSSKVPVVIGASFIDMFLNAIFPFRSYESVLTFQTGSDTCNHWTVKRTIEQRWQGTKCDDFKERTCGMPGTCA